MKTIIKMLKDEKNIIAIGLVLLLIILIVPLLMIAKYATMSADDYAYANMVCSVWEDSRSVLHALLAEARVAVDYWSSWAGLYFGEWLTFVITAAFAKEAYYVTTWITLVPLVLSMMYLAKIGLCKGLNLSRSEAIICSAPWIAFQVLLPPSGVEAFFWMCGSVLFTTALAVSIFHIAVNISVLINENRGNSVRVHNVIILLILGFVQGGMNYVIGLPVISILFFILLYDMLKKNKGRITRLVLFLWNVGWMCVSIFSPGAAVRQSSAGEHSSAIWAIGHSFIEAFKYIRVWGGATYVIALVIIMIPVYWCVASRVDFKFKLPLLFSILSICIYATAFTPTLYALGIIGAYRVQNMYRFILYILIAANEFYLLGYINSKLKDKFDYKNSLRLLFNPLVKLGYCLIAIVGIGCMLLHYGGDTLTTISAVKSLRNGVAQLYYEQSVERDRILQDSFNKDVVLEPYIWPPYLLFFEDIEADSTNWKNISMAQYYNISSVRLRE